MSIWFHCFLLLFLFLCSYSLFFLCVCPFLFLKRREMNIYNKHRWWRINLEVFLNIISRDSALELRFTFLVDEKKNRRDQRKYQKKRKKTRHSSALKRVIRIIFSSPFSMPFTFTVNLNEAIKLAHCNAWVISYCCLSSSLDVEPYHVCPRSTVLPKRSNDDDFEHEGEWRRSRSHEDTLSTPFERSRDVQWMFTVRRCDYYRQYQSEETIWPDRMVHRTANRFQTHSSLYISRSIDCSSVDNNWIMVEYGHTDPHVTGTRRTTSVSHDQNAFIDMASRSTMEYHTTFRLDWPWESDFSPSNIDADRAEKERIKDK